MGGGVAGWKENCWSQEHRAHPLPPVSEDLQLTAANPLPRHSLGRSGSHKDTRIFPTLFSSPILTPPSPCAGLGHKLLSEWRVNVFTFRWWQEEKDSQRAGTIRNHLKSATHQHSGGTHYPHYNSLITVQCSEIWNLHTCDIRQLRCQGPLVPAGF